MRRLLTLLILTAFCLSSSAVEQKAEKETAGKQNVNKKQVFLLIRISDYAKEETYSIRTPEEWKEIEQELKLETKLFPQAITAAEKAWKNDDNYGKKPFPKNTVTKKTAKIIKQSSDPDQITTRLDDIEKRQREKENESSADRLKLTGPAAELSETKPPWDQEREERQKQKDEARNGMSNRARDLFATAMDKLKSEAGGTSLTSNLKDDSDLME